MNRDPLSKRIGMIGGGQLAKMMIIEAKRLGVAVVTLDPDAGCPAGSISDKLIVGSVKDENAIRELAGMADVITYEWELINAEALDDLEREGHTVYPSPASLLVIQDKLLQKKKLREHGLLVPDFAPVGNTGELRAFADKAGYPVMLKTRKDGYDGRGTYPVFDGNSIQTAYDALGGDTRALMTEAFADFTMEISVIATRGIDGGKAFYPIPDNVHKDRILDTSAVPANLPLGIQEKAYEAAKRVMDCLEGVGTFGIEMYVLKDGGIAINEVAPRVHNSGHYTIEGCRTSQFENHIRAILGLPLGDTSLRHGAVIMRNLIGRGNGPAVVKGAKEACALPGVNLHVYGKSESRDGRKMGHYTVTADTMDKAREIDGMMKDIVSITNGGGMKP